MKRLGACLTAAAVLAASAEAYVRTTVSASDPTPVAWDLSAAASEAEVQAGRLTYRLHGAGSRDVTDGSDLNAVERAFASWEALPETALAFTRGPDFDAQVVTNDDVLPVFWLEDSTVVDQGTPDPSDDIDIGGALAVTYTWWWTSGPQAGELLDANLVFNGFDHSWTTDPAAEPGRFDIESIAVHEIGHALGIGHSAVGGATMFPRTAPGLDRSRSLSPDDEAAAGAAYGGAAWAASTARVSGLVRAAGSPLRGAQVVAEDEDGNVVGAAFTLADGSYEIAGLPAGSLEVWAEPLDRADGSVVLFNEWNLPSYWRSGVIDLDFHSSAPTGVQTLAGMLTVLDLDVAAGTPGLNITLVGAGNGFLANSPAAVDQGAKDVTITVAGPAAELPVLGTPLSVSGPGITRKSTEIGTFNGGSRRYVRIVADIDPDAAPGLRSLVIDDGTERTIASGHLEILEVAGAPDQDGDGVPDAFDNCPQAPNAAQDDADSDGAGDACDPCPLDPLDDEDADSVCGDVDNCRQLANPAQADTDSDGAGDACDPCPADPLDDEDADSVCGDVDNCPQVANAAQADADSDGAGDACDPCPADPQDACLQVDLLRNGELDRLGAQDVAAVFNQGEDGGLDRQRDLHVADVGGTSSLTMAGDGAVVGPGAPGVLVFYDVANAAGLLRVERLGPDLRLSGW